MLKIFRVLYRLSWVPTTAALHNSLANGSRPVSKADLLSLLHCKQDAQKGENRCCHNEAGMELSGPREIPFPSVSESLLETLLVVE